MSEAKGLYKAELWEGQNEFVVTGPGCDRLAGTYRKCEAEFAAKVGNIAHAEGVKIGRASRDGLRKALEYVLAQHSYPEKFSPESNSLQAVAFNALGADSKALEADGEGK